MEASSGTHALPGEVNVAFLFCDLKDFTAFADAEGDEAAIEAVDRFFDTVALEQGDDARLMKSLGDGVMLAYRDALTAVAVGARVMAHARAESSLRVHASVHCGVAIARDGDYFGHAVNLAARLLDAAVPTSWSPRDPSWRARSTPTCGSRSVFARCVVSPSPSRSSVSDSRAGPAASPPRRDRLRDTQARTFSRSPGRALLPVVHDGPGRRPFLARVPAIDRGIVGACRPRPARRRRKLSST